MGTGAGRRSTRDVRCANHAGQYKDGLDTLLYWRSVTSSKRTVDITILSVTVASLTIRMENTSDPRAVIWLDFVIREPAGRWTVAQVVFS